MPTTSILLNADRTQELFKTLNGSSGPMYFDKDSVVYDIVNCALTGQQNIVVVSVSGGVNIYCRKKSGWFSTSDIRIGRACLLTESRLQNCYKLEIECRHIQHVNLMIDYVKNKGFGTI